MIRRSTSFIYTGCWGIYTLIAFLAFPYVGSNILFPIIPLSFAGGWFFGRTAGYVIALGALFVYIALNEYYADIYPYYGDRFIAPFLVLTIIAYAGTLKENLRQLHQLNLELDALVVTRTNELKKLTAKLLERTESLKIAHGQGLHDGMGQHITGIQLLCASLKEQLVAEVHPAVPQAIKLQQTAGSVHNRIRKIARMHFPVRINEVGFIPALNELASSVQDIKPIRFLITEQSLMTAMPETTSLQLYRICQEAALHAIDQQEADVITIEVGETEDQYRVEISHNGQPMASDTTTHRLIQYRLNTLSGTLIDSTPTNGLNDLSILTPKKPCPINS